MVWFGYLVYVVYASLFGPAKMTEFSQLLQAFAKHAEHFYTRNH